MEDTMRSEWNAKRAAETWPDQRGHWAPVSWKDHLHDFNVFYNGTILANPAGSGLNRNVEPEDQVFAAELRVRIAGGDPGVEDLDRSLMNGQAPTGLQVASWAPGAAPVYVLNHPVKGCAAFVDQSQFAHVPGGKAVVRGDEPLFLWLRFQVSDVITIINACATLSCAVTVLKPSIVPNMGSFNGVNFNYGFGIPAYPCALCLDQPADASAVAYLRLCPHPSVGEQPFRAGRRNRLAIPGGQRDATVAYVRSRLFESAHESLGHLVLGLRAVPGARVDLVIPMVPVEDAVLDRELALGYDGALLEAQAFWKKELRTATAVRLPEPLLQGYVDVFPRLAAMIAEKHPANGEYAWTSGSYQYEASWQTPTALACYAMDSLGHGREVDKYLEIYRLHQGETAPPSPSIQEHPGYLGSPRTIAFVDWITDHAATLWAAANHGLMSMDRGFLGRWEAPIIRACEFIKHARRIRGHQGYRGILPAAVYNDCKTASQSCWTDAWYHRALRTSARLLRAMGNRRAAEFEKEADEYRRAFQEAYRGVVASSQKWRAPDGSSVPFTPPTLAGARGFEAAHAFSLDMGAMALVFGELFPAEDPIMRASVRWFREGPQVGHFRPFSSEFQLPVLHHEISSCEPVYSWNVFHSYELGDRERFTAGLYGMFAAGGCRQSFVSCETREAVFGNCFTHGTALMLMRMAVVNESADALHLLRMAPLAFFEDGGFQWKNVPTWFGPISISARYDEPRKRLEIRYAPPTRSSPKKTCLHLPPFEALSSVTCNGRQLPVNATTLEL
jgi:hypothetical protein